MAAPKNAELTQRLAESSKGIVDAYAKKDAAFALFFKGALQSAYAQITNTLYRLDSILTQVPIVSGQPRAVAPGDIMVPWGCKTFDEVEVATTAIDDYRKGYILRVNDLTEVDPNYIVTVCQTMAFKLNTREVPPFGPPQKIALWYAFSDSYVKVPCLFEQNVFLQGKYCAEAYKAVRQMPDAAALKRLYNVELDPLPKDSDTNPEFSI